MTVADLVDYHKRAKELVDNCTKAKPIEGAEHWGDCHTMPQAFILELYNKLGEALDHICSVGLAGDDLLMEIGSMANQDWEKPQLTLKRLYNKYYTQQMRGSDE